MKFRLPISSLPHDPNPHRPTTSHALHSRHIPSLLLRSPHLPERTIRLTHPESPRKRRLILLHLYLPSHRTRPILRLLPLQGNLKHRSNPPPHTHSHRLCGLCSPMGPNIILRGHRYHKPILSNSLHWTHPSRVSLRGIFSRQPNPYPILRLTLPPPLCNRRYYYHPPHLPTRIRLKQPPRHLIRL